MTTQFSKNNGTVCGTPLPLTKALYGQWSDACAHNNTAAIEQLRDQKVETQDGCIICLANVVEKNWSQLQHATNRANVGVVSTLLACPEIDVNGITFFWTSCAPFKREQKWPAMSTLDLAQLKLDQTAKIVKSREENPNPDFPAQIIEAEREEHAKREQIFAMLKDKGAVSLKSMKHPLLRAVHRKYFPRNDVA